VLVLPNTKDMTRSTKGVGLKLENSYVRKESCHVNGLRFTTMQCHLHFPLCLTVHFLGLHSCKLTTVALLAC